ncbi:acyl-CoA reductase [Flaviaesturariibacter flavus]|uniref:Acyl-CoA reductase n=1 Tax=Flaviaesturariibacter flavus TaxID=2502780 RepID=A0A4V2NV86_9BACT|nr:acyl-CoA reductase [Flaviaesturariibacter flavus]TCJ12526.1 acyl-CoA reductase [Flaviaesturariibacter flavus]
MHLKLQERIDLLARLGDYLALNDESWATARERAYIQNNWFTPGFVDLATENIRTAFLRRPVLEELAMRYAIPEENAAPKKVGLVMAGNIPLVGFHDLLCTFLAGHYAWIKPSSKDTVLITHLVEWLLRERPDAAPYFVLAERLTGCEAYIATGSDNTARYFEHYFAKYPHIIRKNRTSVALLTGDETAGELEKLADDICQYFGLGCRNVTALRVPEGYNFEPLLRALDKYKELEHHNKYRNNYDYNLAVHIINHHFYMTNGTVLLLEAESPFAPISQVHYQFYKSAVEAEKSLSERKDIQCIVGQGQVPFGGAQCPALDTFADGVDTLKFLLSL